MKQYIPILLSLAFIGCSAPVTAHKDDSTRVDATKETEVAQVEHVTQQQVREQLKQKLKLSK